jgi:hypothetical protein
MCAPPSVCICSRQTVERDFFLLHAIYQQELQHSNTYGERRPEISQVCSHHHREAAAGFLSLCFSVMQLLLLLKTINCFKYVLILKFNRSLAT